MNFRWMEYWDLASGMSQSPPQLAKVSPDALLRCAASRAYYAVFCTIRDFYWKRHPQGLHITNTGRDHTVLSNWLKQQTNLTVSRMGRNLEQLRRYRNWMDYVTEIPSEVTGNRTVALIFGRAQKRMNALVRDMRILRIR